MLQLRKPVKNVNYIYMPNSKQTQFHDLHHSDADSGDGVGRNNREERMELNGKVLQVVSEE